MGPAKPIMVCFPGVGKLAGNWNFILIDKAGRNPQFVVS